MCLLQIPSESAADKEVESETERLLLVQGACKEAQGSKEESQEASLQSDQLEGQASLLTSEDSSYRGRHS